MGRDSVVVRPHGILRAVRARRVGIHTIILDIDGTMTDGSHNIGQQGDKVFKAFGPDDSDAIRLARSHGFEVVMTSADRQADHIYESRARHIGATFVPTSAGNRAMELDKLYDLTRSVYVADGIFDHWVMKQTAFGIAVNDAWPKTKREADAVTSRPGGKRAAAQAIDFVMRRMT